MKVVFDASSNIEAHLVKHQLQQAGIDAKIEGEYLQGAVGELPAMGNVSGPSAPLSKVDCSWGPV